MPAPRSEPAAWRVEGSRVEVLVGDRALLALTPGDRRVHVGLVMPGLDRVVDVTVQPASAVRVIAETGRRGAVGGEIADAARAGLGEAARRGSSWVPPPGVCLVRAFGGVAFPMLAGAYDAGGQAVAEVPRWAENILAAPTVGVAAAVAFGPNATRPVRRGLLRALLPLPSGEIALGALAVALVGRDVLQPDCLARVLSCDRAAHPAADVPDRSTLSAARATVAGWGQRRAERILLDAVARPDGVRLLFDTIRYTQDLGQHGPPPPLPSRLAELHDVHRVLVPSATARPAVQPVRRTRRRAPRPTVVPSAPPVTRRRGDSRQPIDVPDRALPPPAAALPAGPDAAVVMRPSVRALDGLRVGDLTFCVPRTAGDLSRWGRLLQNCLGDFGPAAAAGRSQVLGVKKSNRLAYAIELTPGGEVRQFCGWANRRPDERDRTLLLAILAERRVISS